MTADSSKHEQHVIRVQAYLGTAALLLGVALIFLGLVAEMSGGVPFFMPRSWYVNRSLWYFLAMACFVGGGYLLKTQSMSSEHWEARQPGIRFRRVVIYTRTNCELCDDAMQLLDGYEKYLPDIQEINIETDQSLIERYGTCVPVVEIDEKVRFRGRLNEILLRRLIEGTPPLDTLIGGDVESS
jgi:glutaredoxin